MFQNRSILSLLLFIGTLAVLSSCTPQRRAQWMVNRAVKLDSSILKTKTVFVTDTVTTQSVRRDTTFKYYTRDSVIVREGRLVMKYYYNQHDSTVYLRGECLPDTIIREIPVQVNSVSVIESKGIIGNLKDSLYNPILWLLLVLIVIILFRRK